MFDIGQDLKTFDTSPAFDAIAKVSVIVGTDSSGLDVAYRAVRASNGAFCPPSDDVSAYSDENTYAIKDYCIRNTTMYRCIFAITTPEAWTRAHWSSVTASPISWESVTGREMEVNCPWGTQDVANDVLKELYEYAYQPFAGSEAVIDPAVELGEGVRVGDVFSQLWELDSSFDILYSADISAPNEEEVDHEYPYQTSENREIKRELAKERTSLSVTNGKIAAEVTRAVGAEGQLGSSIVQTADSIKSTVAASGTWYLDPATQVANYQGYGPPNDEEYPPEDNNGKTYLDLSSGKLHTCDGTDWDSYTQLSSIQSVAKQTATEVSSKISSSQATSLIQQTVNNITLSVSSNASSGSKITMTGTGISVESNTLDLEVKSAKVSGTFTADKISTGTLNAHNMDLKNKFTVKYTDTDDQGDPVEHIAGYIGHGVGDDASGRSTNGVIVSAEGVDSLGVGDHYVIVTNAGVRMQAGSNAIYVTASGVRKVINNVDTEIGAAVFL